MNLEELYDYKNRLMADICKNGDIVRLVTGNPEAAVPNHALPYTQIYPYEMVPETVSVAKTFICFDVDIPDVQNKTILTPVIYLWVFTHKSRLRADGGGHSELERGPEQDPRGDPPAGADAGAGQRGGDGAGHPVLQQL